MPGKACTQCGAPVEALFSLGLCNACGTSSTQASVAPTPIQGDTPTQARIREVCDEIRDMLIAKNRAYGDSATQPVRIFSRAPADEQLRVRIDDKLSRLARGAAAGEDVINDLIGYLILLKISGTP